MPRSQMFGTGPCRCPTTTCAVGQWGGGALARGPGVARAPVWARGVVSFLLMGAAQAQAPRPEWQQAGILGLADGSKPEGEGTCRGPACLTCALSGDLQKRAPRRDRIAEPGGDLLGLLVHCPLVCLFPGRSFLCRLYLGILFPSSPFFG